jgi:hypothetical protein
LTDFLESEICDVDFPLHVYYMIQLHKYELDNFNSSQNIIREIESRRITWVQHVDQIGEKNAYKVLLRKPDGKNPLGRCGVHQRIF